MCQLSNKPASSLKAKPSAAAFNEDYALSPYKEVWPIKKKTFRVQTLPFDKRHKKVQSCVSFDVVCFGQKMQLFYTFM